MMLLVVEFSPVQRRVVEGLEKDPDSSKSVITTVCIGRGTSDTT